MIVAAVIAVACVVGVSTASARTPSCVEQNGYGHLSVTVIATGDGLNRIWGSAFCGQMRQYQGKWHRPTSNIGPIRCEYWSNRHLVMLGVLTPDPAMGRVECGVLGRVMRRYGFAKYA
jgi:hypothetical protein